MTGLEEWETAHLPDGRPYLRREFRGLVLVPKRSGRTVKPRLQAIRELMATARAEREAAYWEAYGLNALLGTGAPWL